MLAVTFTSPVSAEPGHTPDSPTLERLQRVLPSLGPPEVGGTSEKSDSGSVSCPRLRVWSESEQRVGVSRRGPVPGVVVLGEGCLVFVVPVRTGRHGSGLNPCLSLRLISETGETLLVVSDNYGVSPGPRPVEVGTWAESLLGESGVCLEGRR